MPTSSTIIVRSRIFASVCAAAMLTACGGGGSGGGAISTPSPPPTATPSPTPSPTPTPTPTPTPPPTGNFDTAEFRRSDGPDYHSAVTAWQRGATGTGEIIAIIDTGIDLDSPEFAGRIHPNSRDVVGNRGAEAEDDHGTNVALVAAAARDNVGVLGIAFDANVLALRADSIGSCTPDTPDDPSLGCGFDDRSIAAGVDVAVSSGAVVVNISLGGGAPTRVLRDAIARASAAGVVIVVSAGNGGDGSEPGIDPLQPDPFATGLRAAGGDNVIIVGSVDSQGLISDFSNRAGNDADYYLSALGERICCVYENGQLYVERDASGSFVTLFSGTSFSAPQVAGAVALLAQAFPNLTGAQIVEILLQSGRDAGQAGVDTVYGRGILDIAQAFAPAGTLSLAGTDTVLALVDDVAIGSAATGDAMSSQSLQTVITDKYRRAYGYDAGTRLRGPQITPRLLGAVERSGRRVAAGSQSFSLAFTIGQEDAGSDTSFTSPLRLSQSDAERSRVLAGRVAARIAPDTAVAFGFSEGASDLVAQLQGQSRPAFMIAPSAAGDDGFLQDPDFSLAVRHQLGSWGVSLAAQQGDAWLARARRGSDIALGVREQRPTQSFGASLDRRFGPMEARLGLTWLDESDTVLGAYFHEALGVAGADTLFLEFGARAEFAQGWQAGLDLRQGVTHARSNGLVAGRSRMASTAWSLDVARYGVIAAEDSIGLRISQPLRVSSGGLNLGLPVAYDYATQSAEYGIRRLNLAPEGREIMGELAWRGPFASGDAAMSLFYRRQPGHYAAAPDDAGVAVRWSKGF